MADAETLNQKDPEIESFEEPPQVQSVVPLKYQGLPSEVVEELWEVPVYIDQNKYQAELERRDQALAEIKAGEEAGLEQDETEIAQGAQDQVDLAKVRAELGITNKSSESAESTDTTTAPMQRIKQLLDVRAARKPALATGLANLYQNLEKTGDKGAMAKLLAGEIYLASRQANYPPNADYDKAWNTATQDKSVSSRQENGWIYRGIMPSKGEKTQTRGSLNINMSPQAVADLDNLIQSGVIRANYKFGDPGNASSGLDRHDAVTVYFLEEPSEGALAQVSAIAQKYLRGNDLLGKKVSEGFYMSEIGSISDQQALACIESISALDPELGDSARSLLTLADGRTAMSEAQFYSLQETLNLFGHNLNYNPEKGIEVS